MSVSGEKIWIDGAFVDWSAANVHILTHTLHYGLGVFEGIRCYRTDDGRSAVFRLSEHIRRLFESARINLIDVPYTPAEIEAVCLERPTWARTRPMRDMETSTVKDSNPSNVAARLPPRRKISSARLQGSVGPVRIGTSMIVVPSP